MPACFYKEDEVKQTPAKTRVISRDSSLVVRTPTTLNGTLVDIMAIYYMTMDLAKYQGMFEEDFRTEPKSIRRNIELPALGLTYWLARPPNSRDPVGFCLYEPKYSSFRDVYDIRIEDLYVVPETRGTGVGRTLLRLLAREALAAGGKLFWEVVAGNEEAAKFYRRMGATPVGNSQVWNLTGHALEACAQLFET